MERNITKILIKKFPPLLVLTFTDDRPLWGPSPPPQEKPYLPLSAA